MILDETLHILLCVAKVPWDPLNQDGVTNCFSPLIGVSSFTDACMPLSRIVNLAPGYEAHNELV
jgi:hypothetical protein